MTNITIVMLPGGRWQLWDGHEGRNGKSPTADYSQPILWLRGPGDSYIARTEYFGESYVKKVVYTDWPFRNEDRSILEFH